MQHFVLFKTESSIVVAGFFCCLFFAHVGILKQIINYISVGEEIYNYHDECFIDYRGVFVTMAVVLLFAAVVSVLFLLDIQTSLSK